MFKKIISFLSVGSMVFITPLVFLQILSIPIAISSLCEGWDEGSGAVNSCVVKGIIIEELANYGHGLLLISIFTSGLPLIILGGLGLLCSVFWIKRVRKWKGGEISPKDDFLGFAFGTALLIIFVAVPLIWP